MNTNLSSPSTNQNPRKKFLASSNTKKDNSRAVIEELKNQLEEDPSLKNSLLKSLTIAKKNAQKDLAEDLYQVLSWPTTIQDYLTYLQEYCHQIPRQRPETPWLINNKYDQSQEILQRLCHFHYLISQEVVENVKKDIKNESRSKGIRNSPYQVQNFPWFSEWLQKYSKSKGAFLDTPESFTEEIFSDFLNDMSCDYHIEDSMVYDHQQDMYVPNNPGGWKSFNQFFARTLNAGLRPIYFPEDNRKIVAPADCTFKEKFSIREDSSIEEIVTIKKTHRYANIRDLLDNSQYRDEFSGGTFIHYFLSPSDYHRFHSPVSGKVLECRNVQGKAMLDVDLVDKYFDAPDDSQGGYEFYQSRGILIIDTSEYGQQNIGKVAVLPIGMSHVSSVIMKGTVNSDIKKGEDFGYFQFGGSDIIMLFQKGTNPDFFTKAKHYKYGESVGFINTIQKSNYDICSQQS